MEFIESMPGITEARRGLLRGAAERYKRAVHARLLATQGGNRLAITATTAEFRNAIRSLLQLGLSLEDVQKLYDEAMSEVEPPQA